MSTLTAVFGHDDPASPLRHQVEALLAEASDLSGDAGWADDVLIAVSELVQNVRQHTSGGGVLSVTVRAADVLIEVTDTAAGEPRLRHPDVRQAGGRGLLLIDAMAIEWGTRQHDGGKTVWARMPTLAPSLMAVSGS